MIGALAYFGVLNPTRFLPDKCQFSAGIGCQEVAADVGNNAIQLRLINSLGNDIVINDVEFEVRGSQCTNVTLANSDDEWGADPTEDNTWNANNMRSMQIQCNAPTGTKLESGERPTILVTITYRNIGSDLMRTVSGELSLRMA